MDRLLNALSLLSIAMIVSVLYSIRRAHIRVEYSVSWLLAALILLGISRMPIATLYLIGQYFGPTNPPAALLMVSGCVFVVVIYLATLRISELKDSNIALAQRVAILEYRLESLDEKIKANSDG
jgi:Uncharacterized conserved protein (DUF2304)